MSRRNPITNRSVWFVCLLVLPFGCAAPPDGGTDGDDGAGRDGPPAGSTTGEYDPAEPLDIDADTIALSVPAGAGDTPATLSVMPVDETTAPAPLPGGVGFTGADFGPDGMAFDQPVEVTARLSSPTIVPELPVLMYDEAAGRWVGTGETAEVSEDGTEATFALDHFSVAGIPDPAPIPEPGGEIGTFVVVSNNGMIESEAISTDNASVVFSEIGDNFKVDAFSQEFNDEAELDTKSLGLSAVLVTRVDNYVIGVIGGGTSLYNEGQANEPVVGVMVMSVRGGTVNLSIYAATPERVISGTVTGPVQ